MLGYVMPEKPELKIKEFELYSGYYCGICKSIERRYGQIPRLTLNYDSVFLALVISSLLPNRERIELERCPVHPIKKRTIVYDEAGVDYAADIMLLLAYFKLKDDEQDENSLKAKAGLIALNPTIKRLKELYTTKFLSIREKLEELSNLEKEHCPSLDRSAEPFAKLMEEIFVPPFFEGDSYKEERLRRMGYHLGKWIYLIDAFDDLDENFKKDTFNPLIYQFGYGKEQETHAEFRERIHSRVEQNLLLYLAELSKAWDEIKSDKNQGIVENIIYFGLLRKTEQIMTKGYEYNAKSV